MALRLLTLLALLLFAIPAAADDQVRLLCGFERDELQAWTAKGQRAGWRVEDGKDGGFEFVRGTSGRVPLLTLTTGDATQGRSALLRPVAGKCDFRATWGKHYMKPHVTDPPRRDALQQRSGSALRTAQFGGLARVMAADWTGFNWLLVDAKSSNAEAELAVLLEDQVIEPPLGRTYKLPAGKWSTLAFDVSAAARDRMLDPAAMQNIEIMIDCAAGKTDILIDNIRLAHELPDGSLLDRSPWRKPFTNAASGKPEAAAVDARPLREPVESAKPTLIDTSAVGKSYTRFSQCLNSLAAFDNRFMIMDGHLASTSSALCTTDGGATWKGLDGGDKATVLAAGHQNTRNLWVDDGGGLMGVFILYCAGGPNRSDIYFRRVQFTGESWRTTPFSLVDLDVRHCPERFALLRLSDGQIWSAWDHLSRDGVTRLRIRVSDDNGQSWRQPPGIDALLDGQVRLGGGPALVPYGEEGVACLWWARRDNHLYWSRSEDRKTWTEPEIATRKTGVNAAVTTGGTDVFFSTEPGTRVALRLLPVNGAKVHHWDGKSWQEEAGPWTRSQAERVASPNLTVTGGTLVAAWVEQSPGKWSILLSKRKADGAWTAPFRAAEETEPLENLVMPRSSPPNFIPLAWSQAQGKWVKTTRVPISQLDK